MRRTLIGVGMAMAVVMALLAGDVGAAQLKVMRKGLGAGDIRSLAPGIDCGGDCSQSYASGATVTLMAFPDSDSTFGGWEGDGTTLLTGDRQVVMSGDRWVKAVFNIDPTTPIPTLTDLTPTGIRTYLTANPIVTTPGRFLQALPPAFKSNWVLMSRSESLQTGIAESPRLLLPSPNAQAVFTIGMMVHSSYPGSHSNAVEYMQWDATDKNFRFHEIVVADIAAMGDVLHLPDGSTTNTIHRRDRGVSEDDAKCFKCHSTRNVLNRSLFPGTTGIPVGLVKWKNKPNWDTYDSWGGMLGFNRDRIYQGSVEAAAFRKLFNLWTWSENDVVRAIIEQLDLQGPGVPAAHVITRTVGGPNDGHINFAFDTSPPVFSEPAPSGSGSISTAYSFDGAVGTGTATPVTTGGNFVTLHHSDTPLSDEGRAVQLFDLLGGADGNLNQQRITDELISHRFATGSHPIDVRPLALAIGHGWIFRLGTTIGSAPGTTLTDHSAFFTGRHGPGLNVSQIVADTRARAQSLPRRKADIEKINLDRTGDPYLSTGPGGAADGLIQEYGAATSFSTDTSMSRLRQEVFRRPAGGGFSADSTVMGGIYVDREEHTYNSEKLGLFRYFLEPLGVSVDKWSMGVRGRSRTYTFADVFDNDYISFFTNAIKNSLLSDPFPGLTDPDNPSQVITAVNNSLLSLPAVNEVPPFTDVQRIFNKSCIECHGGLLYPPYRNSVFFSPTFGPGDHIDFSEDEDPPTVMGMSPRLARSYAMAVAFTTTDPATSYLYQLITRTREDCPPVGVGMMPCGGPALSNADTNTIYRWIVGPPSRPSTAGDPHIRTVDGVNYDFQAVGEFVLLRDEGLEIQARQTAVATDDPLGPNPYTGLTSCVSINTAAAIRIGSDRITYQPHISGQPDPSGMQLRINGKLVAIPDHPIPLASGARVVRTIAPGGIQVEAPGGAVIAITPGFWNYYQVWWLSIDARNVRATMGLMGAIAPGNWLPGLPDGTRLGPRPASLQQRYTDLYEKFGKAWRVSNTTSLFDYAPGTSTDTFTIPSWPSGISNQVCNPPPQPGIIERPPQKPLTLAEAERACNGIVDPDRRNNCIQDVMITGDRSFAITYLLADQIDRNAIPKRPALVFPPDLSVSNLVIAKPVTFAWHRTTDEDGDPINYRLYVWPAGQIPNNNNAEPVSDPGHLSIKLQDGRVIVEWVGTGAQLQSAANVTGPWNTIPNAVSPYVTIPNAKSQFYRLNLNQNELITKTISDLVSGRAYYWKVIAEDGKGGTVESETRRFEVK